MNKLLTKRLTLKVFKVFIIITVATILLIGGIYLLGYLLGPPDLTNEQTTLYYSNDGSVLDEEKSIENHDKPKLDDIDPSLIQATLITEDQRFYKHKGLDFKRIASAVIQNIKNHSLKEGASTLTQQYARNLYLSHEKTWSRKLKEAFYAIRIEMFYSKEQILQGYLNTIYYGHGAYGIQSASKFYFNKSAANLTLAESAMLAGIPKGPTYYSPLNDLKRATNRQQHILKSMLNENIISERQYKNALQTNLNYTETSDKEGRNIAPYFQDTVLREAANLLNLDIESIRSSGLKIHTTLDIPKQQILEEQVDNTLNNGSDVEIGAMAADPNSGAIKALIGGKDYKESPFNRATHAKRLPGSTFKPFLYYAALQHGFTPSTMLKSKPTVFKLENKETYEPRNYNGYYANDSISLAQAVALSDNIYAVKTHLYLGLDTLAQTAEEFGIDDDLPRVPSLALGTAAVSLKDMVKGYGMIANNGREVQPFSITKIIDKNDKEIYSRHEQPKEQKLDSRTTFILTQLLTGMFDKQLNDYTSVTGAPIADKLTQNYAGKSGTTDTDSWMIGYSPSLVTGVWIGYDDNRPMEKVAETKAAKEIWAGFMEGSHSQKIEKFAVPSGVVGVPVDPKTGKRATPYCPTSRVMYYKQGEEPQEYCTTHFNEDTEQHTKGEKGIFERWFDLFSD